MADTTQGAGSRARAASDDVIEDPRGLRRRSPLEIIDMVRADIAAHLCGRLPNLDLPDMLAALDGYRER